MRSLAILSLGAIASLHRYVVMLMVTVGSVAGGVYRGDAEASVITT